MVDALLKFSKFLEDVTRIIKIVKSIEHDGPKKKVRQRLITKWLEPKHVSRKIT